MIKNKLQLGTLVWVNQVWRRRKRTSQDRHHLNEIQWEREKNVLYSGIICGVRTLHNGYSEWWGNEDPVEFKATSHVDAYLIAVNHARTVYAPADAISFYYLKDCIGSPNANR